LLAQGFLLESFVGDIRNVLIHCVSFLASIAADLMAEGAHLALERVYLVVTAEDHVSSSLFPDDREGHQSETAIASTRRRNEWGAPGFDARRVAVMACRRATIPEPALQRVAYDDPCMS
jgi:hypothetical protein